MDLVSCALIDYRATLLQTLCSLTGFKVNLIAYIPYDLIQFVFLGNASLGIVRQLVFELLDVTVRNGEFLQQVVHILSRDVTTAPHHGAIWCWRPETEWKEPRQTGKVLEQERGR